MPNGTWPASSQVVSQCHIILSFGRGVRAPLTGVIKTKQYIFFLRSFSRYSLKENRPNGTCQQRSTNFNKKMFFLLHCKWNAAVSQDGNSLGSGWISTNFGSNGLGSGMIFIHGFQVWGSETYRIRFSSWVFHMWIFNG